MGVDFSACIMFGFQIDELPYDDNDDDASLAWEFNNPKLEIVNVQPMMEPKYVLFMKESFVSACDDDDHVFFVVDRNFEKQSEWLHFMLDYCFRNNIKARIASWIFATYFS